MKVKKFVATEIRFSEITLLSVEEARTIPAEMRLLEFGKEWWLRSPGSNKNDHFVAYVDNKGHICTKGRAAASVTRHDEPVIRPALRIVDIESTGLSKGDVFCAGGENWTVIGNSLALMSRAIRDPKWCDERDFRASFRSCHMQNPNVYALDNGNPFYSAVDESRWPIDINDVNDYEKSDIKVLLYEWAQNKGIWFVSASDPAQEAEDFGITIEGVTIPSKQEIAGVPAELKRMNIPDLFELQSRNTWWLRDGKNSRGAEYAMVEYNFNRGKDQPVPVQNVFFSEGVRPVIRFSVNDGKEFRVVGSKLKIAGETWTVISKDLALCDRCIGMALFREAYDIGDKYFYDRDRQRYLKDEMSEWDSSDLKKYIKAWAEEKGLALAA